MPTPCASALCAGLVQLVDKAHCHGSIINSAKKLHYLLWSNAQGAVEFKQAYWLGDKEDFLEEWAEAGMGPVSGGIGRGQDSRLRHCPSFDCYVEGQ